MFESVSRDQTLSDKVFEQLTDAIVSGKFKHGARLPSERDLGETFQVSRTVIREAMRSLVGSEMVTVTAGRGVEVCYDPNRAMPMRLAVKNYGELEYRTVHEVRVPIELQAAALAASRANKKQIARLKRIVNDHAKHIEAGNLEAAGATDLEFHNQIASIANNPLLLKMYQTLTEVLTVVRTPARHNAEVADSGLQAHRRLLECIADGDADAARNAMGMHLNDALEIWDGKAPSKRG